MQRVRTADKLTAFTCRLCRNSGNFKFLEPSEPVQDFIGIVLPNFLSVCYWRDSPPVVHVLIHEVSRSHTATHHSR